MKTAIIKTTVWKEDAFFELHIDSKLLFLYFLTTPDREVGRLFKYSKRMTVAYTGLSSEQIDICMKQLLTSNLISEYEGYIYLNDTAYSVPKAGRFTAASLKRELAAIPLNVLNHFNIEAPDIKRIEDYDRYKEEIKKPWFKKMVKEMEQKCANCGSLEKLGVDHITPLLLGGTNDRSNLQILCSSCNSKKGIDYKILPEEYRSLPEHNNKYKYNNNNKDKEKISKDINLIYNTYIELFKKNPTQYKLTQSRTNKIKARLNDAGKDMVLLAIEKTSKSPFHIGLNDRKWKADLDFIIRSYEKTEQLANLEVSGNLKYDANKPKPKNTAKPIDEREIKISPQEAEKNRIILQMVRQKKATFSEMKELKSKSIDELRAML